MLTECVDEAGLLLAHEVQVELVPALVDVLRKPRGVLTEVTRDPHGLVDMLGRDVLADDVERVDRLQVPAGRRGENIAAPLVVGDRQRFVVGGRQLRWI
jgi:hypothetical protein